jgi:thimet oligopeptidase
MTLALFGALGLSFPGCAHKGPGPSASKASRGPVSESGVIRSDYAEGEVTQLCQAAIERAGQRLDAVVAVPAAARTIDNTLLAFETALADFSDETLPLTFMGYTSMREKISAEGSACEEKLGQFTVGIFTRKELYEAVRGQPGRNADEKRLLSETVRVFETNGLKLADGPLAEVRALKAKLSQLESQFSTNLNQDLFC